MGGRGVGADGQGGTAGPRAVPAGGAKVFAGDRLRRLRLGQGLSQGEAARRLGVSPSYLSQLEADRRPLPLALRARAAALFGVAEGHFADAEDERLAAGLREASGDPLFGRATLAAEEARATVRASPATAERFLELYRAYLALGEQHAALRTRLQAGEAFAGPPHFPYDEVRDWVQARGNHFAELDLAAERLAEAVGTGATLREDLVRALRERQGIAVADDPTLLAQGTVWRLAREGGARPSGREVESRVGGREGEGRTLRLAEEASVPSRVFWMAHVLGLLECRDLIAREIRASGLATPEARALARIALANYFAGALILPYERFLREAQALRYDIERLQSRFGASFEQVCHRLSTMQRPGRPGIPFFLVKTDIAGNVLKRSSATRFRFARFGGPCPLWNVYRAFAQPGRLIVQVARTPDGVAYLNVARTVGRGGGAYLSRPRNVAVVIGCEVEYAAQTVYAAGLDLQDPTIADPIGPGCRACERTACRHRAVPPASQALDVGTVERGVVPYRIRA